MSALLQVEKWYTNVAVSFKFLYVPYNHPLGIHVNHHSVTHKHILENRGFSMIIKYNSMYLTQRSFKCQQLNPGW